MKSLKFLFGNVVLAFVMIGCIRLDTYDTELGYPTGVFNRDEVIAEFPELDGVVLKNSNPKGVEIPSIIEITIINEKEPPCVGKTS